MKPRNAKTFSQICKLQTDGNSQQGHWISVNENGTIHICQQKLGESPTAKMDIPRGEFNRMIDWYNREQKERKR